MNTTANGQVAGQPIRADFAAAPRGPRLGTKLALLGLPLALLVVPMLSSVLLAEMERWAVQSQSEQLRRIAESIALSFVDRDHLFADLPVNIGEYEALEAQPLQRQPRINGTLDDWGKQPASSTRFGTDGDGAFTLNLGTRRGMLYVHLAIKDDVRVYRDPAVLRLDNADQVRIAFIEPDGEDGRIAVTLSASGGTTAYRMDNDWRFAEIGPPESAVRGFSRETAEGYALELRMPFALLGSRRYFGLSFVDVDDAASRAVRATTHTYADSFLLAFRSPEISSMLDRLERTDMEVRIIDAEQRVRAKTGSYRISGEPPSVPWQFQVLGWPTMLVDALSNAKGAVGRWDGGPSSEDPAVAESRAIETALAGVSATARRQVRGVRTILAGHPIRSTGGVVVGMVAVEQNINDILTFRREAMDQIALVSLASVLVVPLFLIAFAGRLTWRIRNLRRAAAATIDEHGRLRTTALDVQTGATDEIGDLARSVNGMLARLDRHHTFVYTLPRTLRHEMHNPLNTLTTSLEHLSQDGDKSLGWKHMESAKRAVLRMGAIVQNLTDAANLEDSLNAEDLEVLDVQNLVASYVGNCRATHGAQRFDFHTVPGPVYAEVADDRIEQMLDKLIDNAVDFNRPGSAITVRFEVRRGQWRVVVANRGPILPTAPNDLFESLQSHRAPRSQTHFGLGLYVVRVIAEQHGGAARAVNLLDGSGVAMVVQMPVAEPPSARATFAASAASARRGRSP